VLGVFGGGLWAAIRPRIGSVGNGFNTENIGYLLSLFRG